VTMVISENGYIKISVCRWQFNDLYFAQLIKFVSKILADKYKYRLRIFQEEIS